MIGRRRWRGLAARDGTNHPITLTTDFGGSLYEGKLVGTLHRLNPDARVLPTTHRLRPYDVRAAAFVMQEVVPTYPYGVHLGIVHPETGLRGDRVLIVECQEGILVGPDNGILMPAARELGLEEVWESAGPPPWFSTHRSTPPSTETYAFLAASLSLGVKPRELGRSIATWSDLSMEPVDGGRHDLEGRVLYVDPFGNLITNLTSRQVAPVAAFGDRLAVQVGPHRLRLPLLKSFGHASPGRLLLTLHDDGRLKLAAFRDSAARILDLRGGETIRLGHVAAADPLPQVPS